MRFRSLLFIPLNKFDRTIYKKVMHKADALILDLEDALPDALKKEGRDNLEAALDLYKDHPNVFVRINSDHHFDEDIALIEKLQVKNIVYPKFDMFCKLSYAHMEELNIIPIVETPQGLYYMYEAFKHIKNICGVIFGAEDLSAELGIMPTEEAMLAYASQAVLVCAMLKTYCIGYASDFTDLSIEGLRKNCLRSKALGIKAAFCIHPSHLDTINEIYTVEQINVETFNGVSSVNGKMIGPPTLRRMKNL